ncbi:MAG: NYN domain-containing protein [Brotaphodocola sp.]
MGEQEPKRIKKHICVGLLAHVDAGKTTLSEGMLYLTGSIRKLGRVDNRDAFLDTYALERARGITIFSKQAVFELGDMEVTLLDTPGHVDFSAEMERTLQVLDYAILIVSGADGVQGHTETLWRLLKRYRIPVFLFMNKMDQDGTDRETLMENVRKRLDGSCVDFSVQNDDFWENVAMCDEHALEEFLEHGRVADDAVRRLIAERKLFPCYFGSALKLDGVEILLNGLKHWMESPDGMAEFGAKVFKISRDEQGNRLTHLKITGGALKVKDMLKFGEEPEKINQIRVYSGSKFELVNEADCGMVCAVTGPMLSHPGQGIGAESESELPILEPVLTYQILVPDTCDVHAVLRNLRQLEEEEPQLHIVWNESLSEIQAQVMGEVQIEILKSMIADRFGIPVEFGTGNIVYKETILEPVEGVGHYEPLRHYSEVHLFLEPGEQGSGMQFAVNCSEDVLDRNWQRLILTHLEEKRHRGVLVGGELTDMKITLIAGKAHQKHTEGGDFRQATYRAVRQGLREAKSRLLEPYYAFSLEVPTEHVGRAMSDMERMQGTFDAPVTEGDMTLLTGSAPVVTMRDYQREVISYTRGRGRLSCVLKGYEPCHNEEEIIEQIGYDPEADLENPTGSVFCAHGAGFVVPWYEVKHYMHVESPLKWKKEVDADLAEKTSSSGRFSGSAIRSSGDSVGCGPLSFGVDDKELEAIFTRTYGESKRRLPNENRPRRVNFDSDSVDDGSLRKESRDRHIVSATGPMGPKPGYLKTRRGGEDEYLLVDGYNILYAWEEMRELMKVTIDGARNSLLDILCNYQGYTRTKVIVVFDAYKVSGGVGSVQDYHNIHVVYTKEAETADQYIEKFAHKMGRKYRVTVATSDGLEQMIIRGQGCILMSARDLKEDIMRVGRQIQEETGNLSKPGKNYLFANVEKELAEYLEAIRLGNISDGSRAQ